MPSFGFKQTTVGRRLAVQKTFAKAQKRRAMSGARKVGKKRPSGGGSNRAY